MNRLEMDGNTGTMVLMCGSEMIVIKNDEILSEISEYSDSSSSEFGYEEMDLQWSDNMPSERYICQEKQYPYVKLVRCDHLVKDMRCAVNVALDSPLEHGINHMNMKPKRERRPASILMSNDFISSGDIFPLKKHRNVRKTVKKKSHKHDKIVRVTSFVQNREYYARESISNATAPLYDTCASTKVKIETDVTGDEFCINIPVSDHTNSVVLSKEMLNCLPIHYNTASPSTANCFIKSEPIDEYFEDTGIDTANVLVKAEVNTVEYNDTVGIANDEQYPENNIMDVENEWKSLKIEATCRMIDEFESTSKYTLSDQVLTKRKQELHEESDSSDVDVENDWEYPLFFTDLERVNIDHDYCSPEKTVTKIRRSQPSKMTMIQSKRTLTGSEQTTTKGKAAIRDINENQRAMLRGQWKLPGTCINVLILESITSNINPQPFRRKRMLYSPSTITSALEPPYPLHQCSGY